MQPKRNYELQLNSFERKKGYHNQWCIPNFILKSIILQKSHDELHEYPAVDVRQENRFFLLLTHSALTVV